ncbi:MAG: nucleotide exchange factor GrpE [Acidobacteria bacterium]|nr:MAG: nucleotide exchange factor GrpE [Acidobacteriota bacterium]
MAQETTPKQNEEPAAFRVVDRRPFADPGSIPADAAVEEKRRYPTFVEELMARDAERERRYEEKRKQVDEELQRMRARLEGDFRRRLEIEKREMLASLLEVLDNLERTLESTSKSRDAGTLLEGVAMTASLFRSRLKALGVEAIPVLDQPFDPNQSQAVGTVEVSDPSRDGVVVEEVLRGYRLGDQLLRPAQVRVGRLSQRIT